MNARFNGFHGFDGFGSTGDFGFVGGIGFVECVGGGGRWEMGLRSRSYVKGDAVGGGRWESGEEDFEIIVWARTRTREIILRVSINRSS